MKIEQKNNGMMELTADEGMGLRRIGSEGDAVRRAMVTRPDDWEELPLEEFAREKSQREATAEYEAAVERLIRERYSVSAELAILRQRESKPDEFAAYNAYAEQCKAKAKEA